MIVKYNYAINVCAGTLPCGWINNNSSGIAATSCTNEHMANVPGCIIYFDPVVTFVSEVNLVTYPVTC